MCSIKKSLNLIVQVLAKACKISFVLIITIFILIVPLKISAWWGSVGFKIKKYVPPNWYFNEIKYKK